MKRSWRFVVAWLCSNSYCSYVDNIAEWEFPRHLHIYVTANKVLFVIQRRYNIILVDSYKYSISGEIIFLIDKTTVYLMIFLWHIWMGVLKWTELDLPLSKLRSFVLPSRLWFISCVHNYYGQFICKTCRAWRLLVLSLRIFQGQMDIIIFICLAYCTRIISINRYLMVLVIL